MSTITAPIQIGLLLLSSTAISVICFLCGRRNDGNSTDSTTCCSKINNTESQTKHKNARSGCYKNPFICISACVAAYLMVLFYTDNSLIHFSSSPTQLLPLPQKMHATTRDLVPSGSTQTLPPVVNIRINSSEPTTFSATDVIATYSPVRFHAEKQHQKAKHHNDCVWPSHWFSVLSPKLQLPVFTSASQLKMYPDWEKYLMSVYGNSLTFPLDTRGFTFFWKNKFATPPNAVLNFIKSHGGDRNVNLGVSRNARMGEFVSLSAWSANINSPELLHVYGDKDGGRQSTPGPYLRLHPHGFPSHTKVEVYHECCDTRSPYDTGFWHFLTPGSGIHVDLGKTIAFYTHAEACIYFTIKKHLREVEKNSLSFQWWTKADQMLLEYRQNALGNFSKYLKQWSGAKTMGLTGDPVLFTSLNSKQKNGLPGNHFFGIDGRIIDIPWSMSGCTTTPVEARRAGYDTLQYMNHYIGGGTSEYEIVELRGTTNNLNCPSPEIGNYYSTGWGGTEKCTCMLSHVAHSKLMCTEQFVPDPKTLKTWPEDAAARIEKLTVVFTGDVHGYIDNSLNLARMVQHIRKTNGMNHTLLLDAGDGFVGSRFFSNFGPVGIAEEMQQLQYDAMALGNHDFEYKNELEHFVNTSKTPMISANVPNVPGITEYTIVNKGIFRIGITAYSALDVEHPGYIPPKHMDLLIKKLTSVATHLREIEGCNVLILLGHGGIAVDFEIAQHRLFDAILGGHSHVSYSQPQGYVRNQPIVVHSGAYLAEIGVLSLELTIADVCGTEGADLSNSFSYLVNANAMEDNVSTGATDTSPATTKFESWLNQKISQLNAMDASSVVVGNIHPLTASRGSRVPTIASFGKVVASNRVCRYGECILGYLVAKMMRGSYLCQLQHPLWNYTSDLDVSLLPVVSLREAGSIRANLMEGKLREVALREMFPWNNKLHAIQVSGAIVRRMIEHGISTGKDGTKTGGGTLSGSGLMYTVNDTAPLGQRVGTIYVQEKCSAIKQCHKVRYESTVTVKQPVLDSSSCSSSTSTQGLSVASWRVLEPEDLVLCVVTEWILGGGDDFDFLQPSKNVSRVAQSTVGEVEMMQAFLSLQPLPVSPVTDVDDSGDGANGGNSSNATQDRVGLQSPPLLIVFVMQVVGLSANILNHRATRVLFDGDSIEVSLANSFISMFMVLIICGGLEIFYFNTQTGDDAGTKSFQGPVWVTAVIMLHPVMMLNGFAEIGYTCGTAAIYKSSIGIVLKVLAAFVASLCTKMLLPVFGLKESSVPTVLYLVALFLAVPGVYFSLTDREFCKGDKNKKKKGYERVSHQNTVDEEDGKYDGKTTDAEFDAEFDAAFVKLGIKLGAFAPRFAQAKQTSEDNYCINCDKPCHGKYCSECGIPATPKVEIEMISIQLDEDMNEAEDNPVIEHEAENTTTGTIGERGRKSKSKIVAVSLVVGVGFFVLMVANTFWTLFQVVFAHEFGINSTGYISLDQVFGSMSTVLITAISTCLPMTRSWSHNRSASELIGTVFKKTFGSICTSPAAFLYLTLAKFISNGMIAVYFVLSTQYDPGLVVLEMSLMKVIIGVVYTVGVAYCCPGLIAMSNEEIVEITSCSYIAKRATGLIFIMSGLYVLIL